MRLVASQGGDISLGRELGRGGEGSVFEVVGRQATVAKLYHHTPNKEKQDKLQYMAAHGNESLCSFTGWPQDTLRTSRGGAVVGFLMQNVSDCVPIHNLYSPAHRRRAFPRVGWEFLLAAARNTAAAFDALHNYGHVLGDVNQGNVMVRMNRSVVLIDSDSFQIEAGPKTYLCEVGVSHFTPPELQGISGFAGVKRTAQHDGFGLALLVFHLLFGGRHPYSGVPLISAAGNSLEDDIKALRFAYARDARNRGIEPPPRSIPVSLVPPSVEGFFRYAFTEPGTSGQRPNAAQWVTALDHMRCNLQRCGNSPLHSYPQHCPACPWCELDKAGVVYFVDLAPANAAQTGFDLGRIWRAIEAVPPPPSLGLAAGSTAVCTPTPLPAVADRGGEKAIYCGFIVVVVAACSLALPSMFIFFLIAGFFGFAGVGTLGEQERRKEREKRRAALMEASRLMESTEAEARDGMGYHAFIARKQQLIMFRDEYTALPQVEEKEVKALQATARARQLHAFLDQLFIDDATISGVGPAKKAALLSFGIETAADVEWNRVSAVRGFGQVLTKAVVQWRLACEQRFQFDPQRAVTQADIDAVRARIAHRRTQLAVGLSKGHADLFGIQQRGQAMANVMKARLVTASARLAQAQADMAVFN